MANETKSLEEVNATVDTTAKRGFFKKLHRAVKSRKPKLCEEIIESAENFSLTEDDLELLKEIKKMVSRYKFKDALSLMEKYNG
jgi:predicted transglutaminase-like cysteine proteinase